MRKKNTRKKWNKIRKSNRLRSKRLAKKYGDWIYTHDAWSGMLDKHDKWLTNDYDAFEHSGWNDLWHMCIDEINKEIHKSKYLEKHFYFEQIKEKYGEIRAYPVICTKEIDRIIENYSVISRNVCQKCGKPDSSVSKGYWVECVCKDCYEKRWKKKEHQPYEEAYDIDPEHTIIPNVRHIRHYDKNGDWDEYIDISETVNKIKNLWNKKQERMVRKTNENYVLHD